MKPNRINFINFDHSELWDVLPDEWDEMRCFLKECKKSKHGDVVAYARGFTSVLHFNVFRYTDTMLTFKEIHGNQVADILVIIDQIKTIEYEGKSENIYGQITSEYLVTLKNGIELGIHL